MLDFEAFRKVPLPVAKFCLPAGLCIQTKSSDWNGTHVLAQRIYFLASEIEIVPCYGTVLITCHVQVSWIWVPSSGIPLCLPWGIKGWWWYCHPSGALTLFRHFSSHRNPSDLMPASLSLPPSSSPDPSSPTPTPGTKAPTILSLWDCELENIWLVMSTFDPTSQFRFDQKGLGCWCSLLGPGDVCDVELRVCLPVCLPSSFFYSDSLVLSVTASPSVSWF